MNDKKKSVLLWFIAVAFTLALVIYQRTTGPTYPISGETEIAGEHIEYSFLRSFNTGKDAPVSIVIKNNEVSGILEYRRYKSNDEWTRVKMTREKDTLFATLPQQPPAGKVMYNVILKHSGSEIKLNDEPVVLRYKGAVPLPILTPHVFFMFFSLLFGVRAGLEALFRRKDTLFYTGVSLVTVIVGGLILGPIVQKFAFGAYWTGWPFGHDLTDNKTAVIFIFWFIAWLKLRKNPLHKTMVIVATIVMIIVYVIPHSALGSEIDYTKENAVEKVE